MIVNLQMAKLMEDHVLDAVDRGLYEFGVQENGSILRTTSPSGFHVSKLNLRLTDCEGTRRFEDCLEFLLEEIPGVVAIPAADKSLHFFSVIRVLQLNVKEFSDEFDSFDVGFSDLQSVLAAQIIMGFSADELVVGR